MEKINKNYHHINHYKNQATSKRTVYFSLFFTLAFAILELVGGVISNSLALIGDSFHMFSDVLALAGSAVAIYFSAKKPTSNFTFGYLRLEIITAFVNGIVLIAISGYIIIEVIIRFFNPREIDLKSMGIIAVIGLLFNIIITMVLHKSLEDEHNLNVQSALWHFIGDLMNSVGVIISAVIIYFTGYTIVDIIMSIVISIILFRGGYKITKTAFLILMDSTNINVDKLEQELLLIENVESIHELHIWSTNDEQSNAAMHIFLKDYNGNDYTLVENIKKHLKNNYGIDHIFVGIENIKYNDHQEME